MENFATYKLDQTGQQTQAILDQVSTNTADIAQLRALYEALTQSEPVIIQPSDTWPVADPQENVIYRVIDRVNTPPQSYSDYMWNGTAMVLMATYNNAIDNEPTPGSNSLVKSGGVAASIVFDISAYHATGSTLATYANLAAALGTDGANVPASVRKGGMSVKFVKSSDNKYVQYFLTKDEWSIDPNDWEKMNLEEEVSQLGQEVDVIGSGVIDLSTPTETKTSGIKIPLEEGDVFLSGDGSDIVDYFAVKKGDCVHLTSQCATGMTNRWVAAGFCNSIPAVGVGIVNIYAVKLANDTIIDKKDFVAANDGYFSIGYRYTTMTHTVSVERTSVVKYTEQVLTDSQKEQTRININAVGKDEVALQPKILMANLPASQGEQSVPDFSTLEDKIMNAVGDSLTASDYYRDSVSQSIGISIRNCGLTSSTIAINNTYLTNSSFVERVLGLNGNTPYNDADVWMIFGGINDILYNSTIGVPSDTENTTVYGALKSICTYIRQRPNNPKLILVTPYQLKYLDGDKERELNLAIKYVAKMFACPVIDLYNNSDICHSNIDNMLADNIHPNTLGRVVLSSALSRGIKSSLDIYSIKQDSAIQDCATYFGFTVSLIKKFIGIYNLNGDGDQTSDNLLNGFQQLELSDGIIEVQTSDNTELQWANGVAYEDLVKYDYNTVFVKYNDNYPYYIECIGIAHDGVTFTEEEKVLLSKFFRLPLFRNGKMLMDGIVKGNRGLSMASHVNLVSSPRFENPSDWTYGPAWTLSLGDASCNDEGTAYSLLQNVDMEVGSRYKVLFKVSNYQSGNIEFRVDYNLFVSSAITGNGIYEIEFDYTSGGHPSHVKEIMFRPTASGFVGSINYVELYKVS